MDFQFHPWAKVEFFVFSEKDKGGKNREKVGVFRVIDAKESSEITLTWEHFKYSGKNLWPTLLLQLDGSQLLSFIIDPEA